MDATNTTLTNHIPPIRCPQCGKRAYIIQRVPDADKRDGSEVWTFQCVNGHNTEQSGKR
jgi:DNA-directed RNA polymerase subunit RPC12/RpoP